MWIICKIGVPVVVLTCLSFALICPLQYYCFGIKSLILEMHVPGIDAETKTGYTILSVYHCILLIFAITGFISADFTFFLLAVHVLPLSYIYNEAILNVNKALRKYNAKSKEVADAMRKLIGVHQDINK